MKKSFKYSDRRGLPGGPNEKSSYGEGFVVSERGQWDYPGMNTLVPTDGNITMQGVPYPVMAQPIYPSGGEYYFPDWAQPAVGPATMMYPDQDYYFPGAVAVAETPMARYGGGLKKYQTGKEVLFPDETPTTDVKALDEIRITPYTRMRSQLDTPQARDQWIDQNLPKFSRSMGINRDNWNPDEWEKYQKNINTKLAEDIFKRKPFTAGDGNRLENLKRYTPEELDIIKGSSYADKISPTVWDKFKQGVYSLIPDNYSLTAQGYTPMSPIKTSGLTNEEAIRENTPLNLLQPLSIPQKMVQAGLEKIRPTVTGGYTLSEALSGVENDAPMTDKFYTDPLNYMGYGIFGGVGSDVYSASKLLGKNALRSAGTELFSAAMRPTLRTVPSGRMMSGLDPEMATSVFQNAFVNLRDDVINSPLFDNFLRSQTGENMVLNYMERLGDPSRRAELLALADKPQFQALMSNPRIQDMARYNSTLGNANIKNLVNQLEDKVDFDNLLKNADITERSFVGPGDQIITGKFPAALSKEDTKRFDTINGILAWGHSNIKGKLEAIASAYKKGTIDDTHIRIVLNNPNANGKEIVDALSKIPKDADPTPFLPSLLRFDKSTRIGGYGSDASTPIFSEVGPLAQESLKLYNTKSNQRELLQEFLRRNDPTPEFNPFSRLPPIVGYDNIGNPIYQGIGTLNSQNITNLRNVQPEEFVKILVADADQNPFANNRMVQARIKQALEEYKLKPSGHLATGSYNTSYNSWLPQLDILFKYMNYDPKKPLSLIENVAKLSDVNDPGLRSAIEFWNYQPMNQMGYLSKLTRNPMTNPENAFSVREMSQYLNSKVDEKIKQGILPVNVTRPYYSNRSGAVMLPQFLARKYQLGGMANDESDDMFSGMLPQTGIDFTTIPDDVLAIMIANNR